MLPASGLPFSVSVSYTASAGAGQTPGGPSTQAGGLALVPGAGEELKRGREGVTDGGRRKKGKKGEI